MAARAATEAEMLEPWRKNFPICKPYAAHDKADAVRFLRELEEGCDGMDADIDYTLGEVIRGVHRGGNNAAAPPFFGNVNQQAKQTRDRDKRRSKLSSILKRYVLIEGVREDMRAAGQDGEQMLAIFSASKIGESARQTAPRGSKEPRRVEKALERVIRRLVRK